MTERKIIRKGLLFILAGLLLVLFSCAEDATEIERTPTSTFPLTTDSRWEYEGLCYSVPFNDSSLADTFAIEIFRHIIGGDSLEQISDLVVCDDTVITDVSGLVDTSIHRQWLKLENDKLKLFAFDEFTMGDTAEPTLFDFPHNLLDFPLRSGKAWIVYSEPSTQESKIGVGIDYLELPFGWEYCDVVRGTIVDNDYGDTLRASFEWFTDNGLMRLEYDHGITMIRDEFGTILDSARTYEIWELLGIEIRP